MNDRPDAYGWARQFAEAGHPVLPLYPPRDGCCGCGDRACSSPGKHPRASDGLTSASTDIERLQLWERAFPDSNWGVRCDHLVVFDADDADSAEALLQLATSRGEPPGLTVATGRGSHLYYLSRDDRALRQWTGKVPGLRIDLKAGSSYVVVPGSAHGSGAVYEPRGDVHALRPLPDWALPLAGGDLVKGGRAGFDKTLRDELELAPPSGSRHTWMARVCGLLARLLREYREVYDSAVASAAARLPDVEDFPATEWETIRDDIWDRETAQTPPDRPPGGRGPSVASSLVEIADDLFETVLLDSGIAAVVPRSGPNVAAPLNHRGPQAARAKIAAEFFERAGKVASGTGLAEAIETLSGRAGSQEPVEAWMRVAPYRDGVVIDLGDAAGRAIAVGRDGWSVLDRSPVLMFRTSASLPLPLPSPGSGAGLADLRPLFNLTDEQFDLLISWWVGALVLPEAPVAVLVLSGPGGVAKSTATEFAVQLIDPSAVPRRAIAKQQDFHVVTAATRVVPVENVSSMPKWLSDRMSAAVTGDGQLLRTLFETNLITVVSYQRVFAMNGIGLAESISSADLAGRVMVMEPRPIPDEKRLTERELRQAFEQAHSSALAELLDITARVLAEMPNARMDRTPRMADFAQVLLATDRVRGTHTLQSYLAGHASMGDAMLAEGTFGGELLTLLERDARLDPNRRTWTVETNASELLKHMADRLGPKDVPAINQIRHEIDLVRPRLAEEGWDFGVSKSGSRRRYCFSRDAAPGTAGTAGTAAATQGDGTAMGMEGDAVDPSSPMSERTGRGAAATVSTQTSAQVEALARASTNWRRQADKRQGRTR